MPALSWLRNTVVSFAFAASAHASQTVPEVYQDAYIAVRAGIPEIGLQPIHVGDVLSMVVQLEFDSRQVRVESLDSDFFRRAYAKQKGIKLYAPPAIEQEQTRDHLIRVRTIWPFQILDCPGNFERCAGEKIYDLPIISISYQLIDESGQALNNKSVRFRPWPDKIAVAPAIAATTVPAEKITHYFPGGAYPASLPVEDQVYAGLLAFFAGSLILTAGISNRLFRRNPRRQAAFTRSAASRWELALSALRDASLRDDQWADMLRRGATWFCLDELGLNPYAELTNNVTSTANGHHLLTDFQLFFVDLLQQQSIAPNDRKEFLARFIQIAEETVGAGVLEDVA